MTDWRHIPDAPESVKYWRGYDPDDPPECEDDEGDSEDLSITTTDEIRDDNNETGNQ